MLGMLDFFVTNPIVMIFTAVILALSIVGFYKARKSGPSNVWVTTIIEMLPVVGLLGTFAGAMFVFFSAKEFKKEGIVLAFIVSAFAWLAYLVLHFLVTAFGKQPTDYLKSFSSDIRELDQSTSLISGNIGILHEYVARLAEPMQKITELRSDFLAITAGFESTSKSLAALKQMCADDFDIKILTSPEFNNAVEKIQIVTASLERLSNLKQDYSVRMNFDSNVPLIQEVLRDLTNSVTALSNTDRNIELNVSSQQELDYLEKLASKLNSLLKPLRKLKEAVRTHNIDVNFTSNISNIDIVLHSLSDSLQVLDRATKDISLDISGPDNLGELVANLSETVNSLSSLNTIEKDHSINLNVSSEKLREAANNLGAIAFALKEISSTPKDIPISISLPHDIDNSLNALLKLKEGVNITSSYDERVSFFTRIGNRLRSIVPKK